MHLFTACLGTETNTFSPIPTGARLFAETALVRGGAYGANAQPVRAADDRVPRPRRGRRAGA